MVLAYHVVFCAYGFWLPNDPRGSNSDVVWARHLQDFGDATFVKDRRSHASDPHNRALRASAKRALKQDPVLFNGAQARAVGAGFGKYLSKSQVVCYACAILPNHVHLVIARHDYSIEQIVNLLKGAATTELHARGLHPAPATATTPAGRVWAYGLRKVFLDSHDQIVRKIDYVERNPLKERKPRQHWSFVTPYSTT